MYQNMNMPKSFFSREIQVPNPHLISERDVKRSLSNFANLREHVRVTLFPEVDGFPIPLVHFRKRERERGRTCWQPFQFGNFGGSRKRIFLHSNALIEKISTGNTKYPALYLKGTCQHMHTNKNVNVPIRIISTNIHHCRNLGWSEKRKVRKI
jgi:hypothetical protein